MHAGCQLSQQGNLCGLHAICLDRVCKVSAQLCPSPGRHAKKFSSGNHAHRRCQLNYICISK